MQVSNDGGYGVAKESGGGGMDPISALIGGTAQLFGGLFGAAARKKEEERNRQMQIMQEEAKAKQQALLGTGQAQASAFQNLMSNYTNLLGR